MYKLNVTLSETLKKDVISFATKNHKTIFTQKFHSVNKPLGKLDKFELF